MKNVFDEMREALGSLTKTLDILKEANERMKVGNRKSAESTAKLNEIGKKLEDHVEPQSSSDNTVTKKSETWNVSSNNSVN